MHPVLLAALFIHCASPQRSIPKAVNAKARVALGTVDGNTAQVEVEVASSPEAREQGLMFRQSLADDAGMLFLFPNEQLLQFWMKNTFIPLDMIFIRADMSVAGIVKNAEPMSPTKRSVDVPSQFVLEVPGGYADKHGISAGARVRFDNTPAIPSH